MEVVEMEHHQGERKPTDMLFRSVGNTHQQEESGELLTGNQANRATFEVEKKRIRCSF